MREIILTVPQGKTLPLAEFLRREGVSRRLLTKLKRQEGGITRAGETVRTIDLVCPGDVIVLRPDDVKLLEPNPELNVPVIFESEGVAVFDKPPHMPVHPSMKHRTDTLGNWFAHLFPDLTFRPVNRLDRDTSGLCMTAKDARSAAMLQGAWEKTYIAAVHGIIDESGTIDAPIARERESVIVRCVRADGQPAVTHYERIAVCGDYSLAEVTPETGRTHQIRVHFAHIGHPLAGDDLYGGSRTDISRQALHCAEIRFTDPTTGERVELRSALPEDMRRLFGL
ncbi:MAG: RluA family pseudouridine synthase [Ruminococcus sp.]|nr:RluA family pseudouridine synthase [Ruminococcus sp.]